MYYVSFQVPRLCMLELLQQNHCSYDVVLPQKVGSDMYLLLQFFSMWIFAVDS